MARKTDQSNWILRHKLGRVSEVPEINERRGDLSWRPSDPIVVENTGHSGAVVGRGGVGRHGERERRTDRDGSGV